MSEEENNSDVETPTTHADATGGEPSRALPKKQAKKDDHFDEPDLEAADGRDSKEGATDHLSNGSESQPDEDPGARGLVVFDFDGTLIEQDSLQLMITTIVGDKFRAYALFIKAFFTAFIESVLTRRDYMDIKSALKVQWMVSTIGGTSVEHIQKVAEEMRDKLDWRDKLVHDMKACADKGYDVVIASGALNLYLPVLLKGLPVTAMICAHGEVEDGKFTGLLTGAKSRCNPVRHEKRLRLQEYIRDRGPYSHIIGYGNLPDDGPMLSLCDEFFVI